MGAIALDSSALLALLLHEPDAEIIVAVMNEAEEMFLSALNYTETGVVWDNHTARKTDPSDLTALLKALAVTIVPVTGEIAEEARIAYRRFGKGNHPARLNLGDCFSYALSKSMQIPLLYKGVDFGKTDVESAQPHAKNQ